MAFNTFGGFPPQQLSFSKKNKEWRKRCVQFGDNHSLIHYHLARKSVTNMRINYDLLNGKLHMEDLKMVLNPYSVDAGFIPDSIQHYPIINPKIEVLEGEETRRVFDFRVVVTNPNAISEIEEEKNRQVNERLQQLMADTSQSEEQFNEELERLGEYFQYEYQDKREIRGNMLLNHYIKELELPQMFKAGFRDAMTVGEEIYLCDIVGGEPYVEKLDPRKVHVLRSGYSNRIEDADMIILEDYWSPGRVIDTYWDVLSKKDREYIENCPTNMGTNFTDRMDNLDPRYGFIPAYNIDTTAGDGSSLNPFDLFTDNVDPTFLPYDRNGNIRVLKVFWKSRRKVKKVKSYDPETGDEQFNFYPENYVTKEDMGEEEQVFWINEAWEGTKIGTEIYVNMRPRIIQYSRLSNPSRCHFGIVGSIYNVNGDQPYSLVDMMKPYQYLYDVIHDRLNRILARNKGKALRLDFAKVPKGWDADKWMYFLTTQGIAVEDSFKEGDYGAATGKLAGGMNNASNGVIDAGLGNDIVQYCQLLEWIDTRCGKMGSMSPQREGQIANRETVGGVERATLQSSLGTEWLFFTHDSVKKRVLECLLETAKIAMKGRPAKKFPYILSDGSEALMAIDGDEFAECDYGLVVDNSNGTQELNQKLDTLAQAALQNQLLDFSTIMKLYTTTSVAEKQRMVEANERRNRETQQQQLQQQNALQQQQLQQNAQIEQAKMQQEYQMHAEDNETKIAVAEINSRAEEQRFAMMQDDNQITADQQYQLEREKMQESTRQFNEKLKADKKKHEDDVRIKEKQIAKGNGSRK